MCVCACVCCRWNSNQRRSRCLIALCMNCDWTIYIHNNNTWVSVMIFVSMECMNPVWCFFKEHTGFSISVFLWFVCFCMATMEQMNTKKILARRCHCYENARELVSTDQMCLFIIITVFFFRCWSVCCCMEWVPSDQWQLMHCMSKWDVPYFPIICLSIYLLLIMCIYIDMVKMSYIYCLLIKEFVHRRKIAYQLKSPWMV